MAKSNVTLMKGKPMKTKLVVAHNLTNGIGKDNAIPWNCKEDLQLFKSITEHTLCIMGRATHESLVAIFPKGLPNRQHVVLTRSHDAVDITPGIVLYRPDVEGDDVDLEKVVAELKVDYPSKDICFIGGAEIYNQAILNDLVDEYHISRILNHSECDTHLNIIEDLLPILDNFGTKTNYEEFYHYKLNVREDIQYPILNKPGTVAELVNGKVTLALSDKNLIDSEEEFETLMGTSTDDYKEVLSAWTKIPKSCIETVLGKDTALWPPVKYASDVADLERSGYAFVTPKKVPGGRYVFPESKIQKVQSKWHVCGGQQRAPHTIVVAFDNTVKVVGPTLLNTLLHNNIEYIKRTDLRRLCLTNVANNKMNVEHIESFKDSILPEGYDIFYRHGHVYIEKKL